MASAARPAAAFVTGGASGIGKATCELLARSGFRIAVADRDVAGARRVAEGIGGLALEVDVGDEASVVAGFDLAERKLGSLKGLVTAAGIVDRTPLAELDVATWERVQRINLLGTFLCLREAARRMKKGARICTIASIAGKRGGGLFGTAAYASSKGGVIALTRSAARELAPRGIAVNGIAPGPIETPMIAAGLADSKIHDQILANVPLGRVATPAEAAEAIAFLLSSRASFVHGEILMVDGGLTMD